jgi:hypothetical protein
MHHSLVFLLGESFPVPAWEGIGIFPPDQAASAETLLLFNLASMSLLRSSLSQLSSSPQLQDAISRSCLTLSRIVDELRSMLDCLPDTQAIASVAQMLAAAQVMTGAEAGECTSSTTSATSNQAVTLRICYLLHFLSSVARVLACEGHGSGIGIGVEMQRVLASVTWCCQLSTIAVAVAFSPPPATMDPSLHALAMSLITDFASQTAQAMVSWSLTRTPPSAAPFPLWAPLWSLPPAPSPPSHTAATPLQSATASSSSLSKPAATTAGHNTSLPHPPLRCNPPTSGSGADAVASLASDPLSCAAAACAYTDYYLAAFTANVCECIASVARSNKSLLQHAHMRALAEGLFHKFCPPPVLLTAPPSSRPQV